MAKRSRAGRDGAASTAPPPVQSPGWPEAAIALLLAVATMVVYLPVAGHRFLNFDDPDYVSENAFVGRGITWAGTRWAFTSGHAGNWHPLTWLSHMLDVQLFGLDAGAHHLMNAALHAATVALLFALFVRLTGARGPSALLAALFAVHPLHVESVAWIAERKDVLSALFFVLSLGAYAAYARRSSVRRYSVLVVCFACGLMAKPMVVTLPIVLMLLDVWPLGGARPRLLNKLPLLAMAAAAAIVTIVVQQQAGAVKSLEALPFSARLANAAAAYVTYLGMTIWPVHLAAIYPYHPVPAWEVTGAIALLVTLSIAAVRVRVSHPYVLVGWLWYLITLLPVIGLIQVGGQPLADRYMYLPSIGLFIIVVWGGRAIVARARTPRVLVPAVSTFVVLALAIASRAQVGAWRDGITLWQHAIAVTEDNYRAHSNLGHALAAEHRLTEAIAAYDEALGIKPDFAEAHNYLGQTLTDSGRFAEAIAHFRAAIDVIPRFVDAHNNLGLALAGSGHLDDAAAQFSEAIRLDPGFPPAHGNLGIALAQQGHLDQAVGEFRTAVTLEPESVEAHLNLAAALGDLDRSKDAMDEIQMALRLDPDNPKAQEALRRARGR